MPILIRLKERWKMKKYIQHDQKWKIKKGKGTDKKKKSIVMKNGTLRAGQDAKLRMR